MLLVDRSGELNLPGGRMELEDTDPFLTLVRELGEEIPGFVVEGIAAHPSYEIKGESRGGGSLRWLIFTGIVAVPATPVWRIPNENLGFRIVDVKQGNIQTKRPAHPMADLALQIVLNNWGHQAGMDIRIPEEYWRRLTAQGGRQRRTG